MTATCGEYPDRVRVDWLGQLGNEQYFKVYRSASPGGQHVYLGRWDSAGSFFDPGAIPGAAYNYRVKACNAAGCSGFSAYAEGGQEQTTHRAGCSSP